MRYPNRVREWRQKANISPQYVAAQRFGIAPSTYSLLETGARKLSLAHAQRIARELGCKVDDLLVDEPEEESGAA